MAATAETASAAPTARAVRLDKPLALADVPTPALVVDVEALERNLDRMARHAKARGVGLRPHTKTHKCPVLAKMQLDRGAVGVCAAKVGEAEVMIGAGIDSVLITSPIVSAEKIARVVALAGRSDELRIVVDHPRSARDLAQAAAAAGVTVNVLIDLDPGIRRTGIAPGQPALDLLGEIRKMPSLRFDGLQAYAGHVMHVDGWSERRDRSQAALEACLETKRLFEKQGHEVPIFSGGGTGTFDIDCDVDEFTDLQVGSYLFMDLQYREIGDRDGEVFDYFEPSLFVQATAISQPVEGLITLDAGFKALASDAETPVLRDVEGAIYHWGGDEHGIVDQREAENPIELGDQVAIMVPHCDPTVNLYDNLYPVRDGRIEELWPIAARGRSQ
jgi:D-serine deaminase-like pyridoxal phosphate-dependent protein